MTHNEYEANRIERAKSVFRATEWSGDSRVNMITMMNAGIVLLRHVEELEWKNKKLDEETRQLAEVIVSLT